MCCPFRIEVLFSFQNLILALLASRFLFFINFIMLSREFAMYVCMSVNELLRVCSIIASMRLRLDLEGGYSIIRYVTQGGGGS